MKQVRTEAEFDAIWNDDRKVLGIVFDPDANAAASACDGVAGNAPQREAVWIRDPALADAKRAEHGCGSSSTTCFFCLDRHNVTGLDSGDAESNRQNNLAFARAETHD